MSLGHGPTGVSPEDHKHDQGAGASLLGTQAERDGVAQPGEETVPGRAYSTF